MASFAARITPFLWFDTQAEDAAIFYTTIFKNARIHEISRYGKAGHETHGMDAGSVMTVAFELEGQRFIALNGGPYFKFNEAISFQITCETQDEIDYFWDKLSEGGEESRCGWLKDKFGLSWQVVPSVMDETLQVNDTEKLARVTEAFLKMKKFDITKLKEAYGQTGKSAA